MKNYRFYKDEDGWFVDLPEWEGDVWELQMVAGADIFLDVLSQGKDEIYVTLSDTPFDGAEVLVYQEIGRLEGFEMGSGAWYLLQEYMGITYNLKMWLCEVTKHPMVFGHYPNKIYFS
jgi:hypothetical protein